MLLKLLMAAALIYGAVVAAIYLAQTHVLFPVSLARAGGPPLASAERLEIMSTSGQPLRGLYIPAAVPQPERLVILGFGGNAWNADDAAIYLHELYPAADIITFHYRGYPPSKGRPSTSAHIADAPLVYDYVRSRFGDVPIVAVGFSIGSGIVASLAPRRPLTGAILVTPFDSLAAVASENYPWLPIRLLLRHRLDAAADLRGAKPEPSGDCPISWQLSTR
jgi:pimeloyl-ACP methyl ester carboxylesterase